MLLKIILKKKTILDRNAITCEHLSIGGQELGGVRDKGEVANGGPALQKATGGV